MSIFEAIMYAIMLLLLGTTTINVYKIACEHEAALFPQGSRSGMKLETVMIVYCSNYNGIDLDAKNG